MIHVHSKALESTVEVERIIGKISRKPSDPTLIFVGGIHGNEPAGILAMQEVFDQIQKNHLPIKGNVFFLAGNLQALDRGVRYLKEDLNRMWTDQRVNQLLSKEETSNHPELEEQAVLLEHISNILDSNSGPFYFFDIHTTSSHTQPFLTVNDSLLNRAFTSQYPLPVILGIEEYLNGPILSFINEKGYVAFGFEAGQHDELTAIENAVSFCYLSMVYGQVLDQETIDYDYHFNKLSESTSHIQHTFEIVYRHDIAASEKFVMKPGFTNFQEVAKGDLLAHINGTAIQAQHKGRIFMPLYQEKGTDGYYQIKKIPKSILRLSAKMRKLKLDKMLTWLPGIRWMDDQKSALIINKKIARFMAKELLHLLGYRSINRGSQYLHAYNREAKSRTSDYRETCWIKRKG